MEAMNGASPYSAPMPPTPKLLQVATQKYRYYLDKTTPHVTARWAGLVVVLLLYGIRVWLLKGARMPCSQRCAADADEITGSLQMLPDHAWTPLMVEDLLGRAALHADRCCCMSP